MSRVSPSLSNPQRPNATDPLPDGFYKALEGSTKPHEPGNVLPKLLVGLCCQPRLMCTRIFWKEIMHPLGISSPSRPIVFTNSSNSRMLLKTACSLQTFSGPAVVCTETEEGLFGGFPPCLCSGSHIPMLQLLWITDAALCYPWRHSGPFEYLSS